MPTEIAPPITEKPINPFDAALDKAFKPEAGAPELGKPDAAPAKEKPAAEVKESKQDAPKTGTPRELFKKPGKEDAAAKPEPPKSAFDDITEPVFKDEKGKAGWTAVKAEGKKWETTAKAHEARIKELEGKLTEYEPLRSQLVERDAKLAEQSELVARVRLDDQPEFRKEFIDHREDLVKKAQDIVEESGGDRDGIALALNLKKKARTDAIRESAGDLDSFQAARLGRVIDELTDLDERAEAKRAKSKQTYAELQEAERQREIESRAKTQQTRKAEFEDTLTRLRGDLEVLNKADGYDQWSARAERIVSESRDFIEANPGADIEAEILARSIPAYRELFLQADEKAEAHEKKITELEAELKAIHSTSPSLRSSGRGAESGDKAVQFDKAMSEAFGGA